MSLFPGMEGLCPQRAQKGRSPSEGVDSRCCGNATPVETAHRAVSKSRLSNPPPSKQKNSILTDAVNFGGRWWIRTTEVIDDRFTVWSKPTYLLTISGSFPCFSLIQFSVRQLCRRFAPVFGIDVGINLRDLDGRMSEQGLHGAQLGAALDEVGRVGMPQLVR